MPDGDGLVEELGRLVHRLYEGGYLEAARRVEEAVRLVLSRDRERLIPPATD